MPKVQIFAHQSQAALTESINKFIEDNNLASEYIHDIKLAGTDNKIIAMIVYEVPEVEEELSWDEDDEFDENQFSLFS